jgi:hypothetical protein
MDHDGNHAPPDAAPPGGEPTPAAWRLTFEFEDDKVRVVAQQRVAMMAPPDDTELLEGARAGYWAEVRDADGEILYRQVLHAPIQHQYEVHSPEPGEPSHHVDAPRPKGVFQVVVPDLPAGREVVIYGRASVEELAERSAKQLAKAVLRETPRAGGEPTR